MKTNPDILRAAELLLGPGGVREARITKAGKLGTISGYFDAPEALAAAVSEWDARTEIPAIYVTLNPTLPALHARAHNRLKPYAKTTTSDSEIARRHWLLVDVDPARPSEIGSSDAEKAAAREVLDAVAFGLLAEGWPDPVIADSGNGWHLLYRIDLPNDDASRDLLRAVLQALAARYDRKPVDKSRGQYQTADGQHAAEVDLTVYNAARISKLYGTMTRKGDHTPDRPHRRSALVSVPNTLTPVTLEQLQAIAAEVVAAVEPARAAAVPASRPTVIDGGFDVAAFIQRHALPVHREAPFNGGGRKWVLKVCPWNSSHTDNSAWISVQPHGAVAAGCSHNSCSGRTWHDLRAMLEPKQERPALRSVPTTNGANALQISADTYRPAPTPDEKAALLVPYVGPKPANVHDMRRCYVKITGTTDVWCLRTWRQVPITAVKSDHPRDYKAWSEDDNRLEVDQADIVFEPAGTPPGCLNLFRGFGVAPDPSADCQRLVAHLAWLCGSDPDLTHWVTCWLAYPLQYPGTKLQTALVMHGPQGSGKNVLFDTMVSIYGKYGSAINQQQIESQYTGWASQKLFILADEVLSRADVRVLKNRLKTLITSPTIQIEDKFVQVRPEANHLNIVFLSNEDMPVALEDDDRRHCVVKTPKPQPRDYYDALAAEIDNGGAAGFMAYLLAYDLQGWGPHAKPPETDARNDMKRLARSSTEAFFEAWAEEETPLPFCCCSTKDLYAGYRVWCELAGERWGLDSEVRFLTKAKKLWPAERKLINDGRRVVVLFPDGRPFDLERITSFNACLTEYVKQAQRLKV